MSFTTVITTAGQAAIAAAIAGSTPLQLDAIAVGDGGGSAITPTAGMTGLVHEVYRAAVNRVYRPVDFPSHAVAELIIPSTVGGFTLRECGIFNTAGTLIAVANLPATYKPTSAEGAVKELVLRIIFDLAAQTNVTLTVSGAVVSATRTDIDAEAAARAAADATLTTAINGKAPLTHGHAIGDVSGLQTAIDGKAPVAHTHQIAQIIGLQPALDGKSPYTHSHAISQISGLQTSLDGKSPTGHGHTIADTSGLQSALDAKAPATHGHSADAIAENGSRRFVSDAEKAAWNAKASAVIAQDGVRFLGNGGWADFTVNFPGSAGRQVLIKNNSPTVLATWHVTAASGDDVRIRGISNSGDTNCSYRLIALG